jgi:hypothetical protein
MRKSRIILIVFLLLFSSKEADAHGLFEAPKGTKFIIANGSLNVNGTYFNQPWKINPFLTAVGGKYLTKNLFHKVYTFDELGVHVYEYPKKEEANEVQLSFVKQKMKFAPKSNFQGSFKIETMTITRKTSIHKVLKTLPDYKFTKSSSSNSYRGEYKGVYIYLNYSKDSLIDFISFGMSEKD